MLVGVLCGDSLADYYQLTRLAPIPFVVPPMVCLSSPEELISSETIAALKTSDASFKFKLEARMFKHLYNSTSGIPGFFGAMLPMGVSLFELRHRLGVLNYEDPFIPTMIMCVDGMRSAASRAFCKAVSDQLYKHGLVFDVFYAESDNVEHEEAFKAYNPDAQRVFNSFFQYQ